MTYKISDIPE